MADLESVLLLTNEYPPHIYGGAGVHVEYLSRALSRLIRVEVRCFGDQDTAQDRLRIRGFAAWDELDRGSDAPSARALKALSRNLLMAAAPSSAGIAHAHTWYAAMAGVFLKTLHDIPLVVTTHSLEPLRPWKAEQLGAGYRLSSWAERASLEEADAVIAVSHGMRRDIVDHFDIDPEKIRVIHNGIDPRQYRPARSDGDPRRNDSVRRHGIDPERPYVLFVGRITRQKGITHLVRAIPQIDPRLQVVLCAGEPDTEAIRAEMEAAVTEARGARDGILWIQQMLPREEVIALYGHAAVFCCPSVYEPFGIINLEAMACETAVVASRVGGIPEVVVHGETGRLVPLELKAGSFDPLDPGRFSADLAREINAVGLDPQLQRRYGEAGRARVEAQFSWDAIARRTLDLYEELASGR